MPVITNSVTKIIKAKELTAALSILRESHVDNTHDRERYKSIITVVHAIINEEISFEQLKSYHITCSRCLATIQKDLSSEVNNAVIFLFMNYHKVDERIFSRVSIIDESGEEGKAILISKRSTELCYEFIKAYIKYSVIEETFIALQKIPNRQFLTKPSSHLVRILEDYDTPTKSLSFIRTAISSGFITADEIIKHCVDDEAREAFEQKIYILPNEEEHNLQKAG